MLIDFMPVSLVDYPGQIATTIFIGGCNFKCPYCHNAELISPYNASNREEELYKYLKERRHLINSVCITGGEPTIWPSLLKLITHLKKDNYNIKLDTNGTNPELLSTVITQNLVDYIAMDIKTTPQKYYSFGANESAITNIKKSVDILMHSNVDYEFRTTVNCHLLSLDDAHIIGEWLCNADKYVLQGYKYSEKILNPQLCTTANCTYKYLEQLKEILSPYIEHIQIRS